LPFATRIRNGLAKLLSTESPRAIHPVNSMNLNMMRNTMNYLIKLAGSIGYSQQVHAGLVKSYQHEKRLVDVEKKLAILSPEMLAKLLSAGN